MSTYNPSPQGSLLSGVFYYCCNHIFNRIPSLRFRRFVYTNLLGYKLGIETTIQMGCYIYCRASIGSLEIGDYTMINRDCVLDSRGRLFIGSRVNISPYVHIYTAAHDIQSRSFDEILAPVTIGDYCWLSTRSTILPGVTIGKGAVVAAGTIVSRDVEPFTVVGGSPNRVIGQRSENLDYSPVWQVYMQ